MKRFRVMGISLLAAFLFLVVGANLLLQEEGIKSKQERNVLVNRITLKVQSLYEKDEDINNAIEQAFVLQKAQYEQEYAKEILPQQVSFIALRNLDVGAYSLGVDEQRIIAIQDRKGEIIGVLSFGYNNSIEHLRWYMNLAFLIGFGFLLFLFLYVYFKILYPFTAFIEYPEKLAKNKITDKLPESKNKYFGQFVWGINMLNDRIVSDKRRINRLRHERQVMLTTIAHGIKTPVSNVKLYASSIEMGLYQPDGIPNESDADIAKKIDKNADDITRLVQEMLETTSTGMVDFEPNLHTFYIKEIVDSIEEAFADKLKIQRIPYSLECCTQALMCSDKEGILRILSQIMENAIKYRDGRGIKINVEKQEEGFNFLIKNTGELLSEQELPFIFNSFWRGSNAEMQEGSGIGLFEARTIANKLGGDICVKRLVDSKEIAFEVFLPQLTIS